MANIDQCVEAFA